MAKSKTQTTRAKREAREAKSTLFTTAQLTRAGLKTYSPSYVQKQYSALTKSLSASERQALEANRASEGFTKQDALLYYQMQKKHDTMRRSIEDEVLSGAKLSLAMEKLEVRYRRADEDANDPKFRYHGIEGVPTPVRTTTLLNSSKRAIKHEIKTALQGNLDATKWKVEDLRHIRKSVNMAIDSTLWGATQQDELRFLISKMTNETLEKWALSESSATVGLNLQAFSEVDDGDVEMLDDVTADMVEQAKEVLKKYQNYTSRKYK